MTDTDDEIQLSDYAKKALAEFLEEQKKVIESNEITEDWQLSQFWYTYETSEILAKECLEAIKPLNDTPKYIACVSCPSVMEPLMKLDEVKSGKIIPIIFEYDKRFESKYPDNFQFFDFNHNDQIDPKMIKLFDIVIADPPFLSDDCQLKTAVFVRKLLKQSTSGKIIICTGETMQEIVKKAFNANKTNFEPKHKNNLSNAFACYTNYQPVTL